MLSQNEPNFVPASGEGVAPVLQNEPNFLTWNSMAYLKPKRPNERVTATPKAFAIDRYESRARTRRRRGSARLEQGGRRVFCKTNPIFRRRIKGQVG
jgi:hypothetical protein